MSKGQKGFSTIALVLVVVIAGVSVAGWLVWRQNQGKKVANNNSTTSDPKPSNSAQNSSFDVPKKGAHFETSTPSHGSSLPGVPVYVVIDFNFDLASNSTLKIEKDGKDYSSGETKVDSNKLAMRRHMDQNAPDGVYNVNYKGCWPDKSCHVGSFQFVIDRSLLNTYQDQRGVKEASIQMSQLKFKPANVRIGVGQTMTWVNDDDAEHYVNTDSHPAHTYVPGLNSKALAKGAIFSFVFMEKGVYPYHCSAHAADMVGNIVVE